MTLSYQSTRVVKILHRSGHINDLWRRQRCSWQLASSVYSCDAVFAVWKVGLQLFKNGVREPKELTCMRHPNDDEQPEDPDCRTRYRWREVVAWKVPRWWQIENHWRVTTFVIAFSVVCWTCWRCSKFEDLLPCRREFFMARRSSNCRRCRGSWSGYTTRNNHIYAGYLVNLLCAIPRTFILVVPEQLIQES